MHQFYKRKEKIEKKIIMLLQDLGKDVLSQIYEFCDENSIQNLSQTNRYFYIILFLYIKKHTWILVDGSDEGISKVIHIFAKDVKNYFVDHVDDMKYFWEIFLWRSESALREEIIKKLEEENILNHKKLYYDNFLTNEVKKIIKSILKTYSEKEIVESYTPKPLCLVVESSNTEGSDAITFTLNFL